MSKYHIWLPAIIGSMVMAMTMSGIITTINSGIDAGLIFRWMRSFSIAWPIALTLNLLVLGHIRRFAMGLADRLAGPAAS